MGSPEFNLFCRLLTFSWAFLLIVSHNNGVKASHRIFSRLQSFSVENVDQTHRTAYHFQPPRNWINDPNGPMYYNGVYHLFYQYNPKGAVWGNIVWAHSVSKDLINWEALEPAIYPSKPFDINGTWSGSATIIPGKGPVILYTGLDANQTQLQNYAVPANLSDPYLRVWNKPDDNPLVVPDHTMNRTAFRDPTTAWWGPDNHWRMVVGSKRKHRGIAYLYRSLDFKRWVKAKHPLHSKNGTGMWECPDFFPVSTTSQNGLDFGVLGMNVKHAMKVSLDKTRYEYYTIGTYDTRRDRFYPDSDMVDGWDGLRPDYGNFYASKSFFDPTKNRRIFWGWANESDTVHDDKKKGWAGIQTIPRTVVLDPSGKQLVFWPIEEIERLRGHTVQIANKRIELGQRVEVQGITPAQADVEVTFSIPDFNLDRAEPYDPKWTNAQDLCGMKGATQQGGIGPFGLITLASADMEENTPVFFRIFKDQANNKPKVLMCSDATHSSLKTGYNATDRMYKPSFGGFVNVDLSDKRISLRSLIDHSVIESFAARGKTCITSRVYPIKAVADKAHLLVFNNGAQPITVDNLTAWSMQKPLLMNN